MRRGTPSHQLSGILVDMCVRWGIGKASKYSDSSGPLYSISPPNGISQIRLCIAGFPIVDALLATVGGAD